MPNANIELEKAVDNLIECRRKLIEAVIREGIKEAVETTVYLALANGDVSIREIFELHPEGQVRLKGWGI